MRWVPGAFVARGVLYDARACVRAPNLCVGASTYACVRFVCGSMFVSVKVMYVQLLLFSCLGAFYARVVGGMHSKPGSYKTEEKG